MAWLAHMVRPGSLESAARTASASRWSGCSWVTMTAVAPSRAAAASLKLPGSMTSTAPSLSSLTHECPSLVNRITSLQPEELPAFRPVRDGPTIPPVLVVCRYLGDRYLGDRYRGDRYRGDRYRGYRATFSAVCSWNLLP